MRVHNALVLTATTLLASSACVELTAPPEGAQGPMIGVWILTSLLTRDSLPSTCSEQSVFTITEQSAEGALSWTLNQTVDCQDQGAWLQGTHYYHDTWENTAWAVAWNNSVRIQTPDPWWIPSCRYSGTVDASLTRMSGIVVCQDVSTTSRKLGNYRGTWEGVRQEPPTG